MNIIKNYWLIVILFLAFALRVWGLGYGTDTVYNLVDDEFSMFYGSLSMLQEKSIFLSNPAILHYPILLPILYAPFLAITIGLRFLFGQWSDWSMFLQFNQLNPNWLLIIPRLLTAFFGVGSVWLVYKITKEFLQKRFALLASLLMAVDLSAVIMSHFALNWMPGVFFVLGASYNAIKVQQTGKMKYYLGATIFTGLAFGVNYALAIIGLSLIIAHLIVNKKFNQIINKKILIAGLIFIALGLLFIFTNLFAWNYHSSKSAISLSLVNLPYYLQLIFFYQPVASCLAIVGLIIGCLIKKYRVLMSLLVLPAMISFLLFSNLPYHEARYLIQWMPVIFILTVLTLDYLSSKVTNRLIITILVIIVVIGPFALSLKWNQLITKTDTRLLAQQWSTANIPIGSKVIEVVPRGVNSVSLAGSEFKDKYGTRDLLFFERTSQGLGLDNKFVTLNLYNCYSGQYLTDQDRLNLNNFINDEEFYLIIGDDYLNRFQPTINKWLVKAQLIHTISPFSQEWLVNSDELDMVNNLENPWTLFKRTRPGTVIRVYKVHN